MKLGEKYALLRELKANPKINCIKSKYFGKEEKDAMLQKDMSSTEP